MTAGCLRLDIGERHRAIGEGEIAVEPDALDAPLAVERPLAAGLTIERRDRHPVLHCDRRSGHLGDRQRRRERSRTRCRCA
jgi:hypothetical protein